MHVSTEANLDRVELWWHASLSHCSSHHGAHPTIPPNQQILGPGVSHLPGHSLRHAMAVESSRSRSLARLRGHPPVGVAQAARRKREALCAKEKQAGQGCYCRRYESSCVSSPPSNSPTPADEFEVAIFLRESRTRHSLLTRNKTFHEPDQQNADVGHLLADPGSPKDTEIMIESDDEGEPDLHNIPQAAEDDTPIQGNGQAARRRKKAEAGHVPSEDVTGDDEKKLSFTTHYESFNICGWLLCLLVTRKGDRARRNPAVSEANRQPLLEEWISTQAQASVDED